MGGDKRESRWIKRSMDLENTGSRLCLPQETDLGEFWVHVRGRTQTIEKHGQLCIFEEEACRLVS